MKSVRTLIVGAGISGLATAAALQDDDYLVLEADNQIGGYCKTIRQDGFVWDYSGHFFHFKHPDIERWLCDRMAGQTIRTVQKRSFIDFADRWIDFPFQKNIHQLPQDDFIDCLHDLYFAHLEGSREGTGSRTPANFKEMLYGRFGRSIAEKFLIPYNQKLYACDLSALDTEAMGRFFPHADLTAIVRNMRSPDNASYNSTFTYPEGGAFEYVKALASAVDPARIALCEPLIRIDRSTRTAKTSRREIQFERLVSSAPFNRLLGIADVPHDPSVFSWNKVLVFNLGFDAKGPREPHWVYYPDPQTCFYRVGFYDNILERDRMSLYVEIGCGKDDVVDANAFLPRVLADLKREGVVTNQRLISHHSVVMDPAYVHITKRSMEEHTRLSAELKASHVYPIGRYGGWTYCSIEDNIVEARTLVDSWR